jgi:hypothetical protein
MLIVHIQYQQPSDCDCSKQLSQKRSGELNFTGKVHSLKDITVKCLVLKQYMETI